MYAPSPLFVEAWLDLFRTPSSDRVAERENAIHDENYGCFNVSEAKSRQSTSSANSIVDLTTEKLAQRPGENWDTTTGI